MVLRPFGVPVAESEAATTFESVAALRFTEYFLKIATSLSTIRENCTKQPHVRKF